MTQPVWPFQGMEETLFKTHPAPMALEQLPQRRILEVNHAFLAATGYSRAEVIGESFAELGLFRTPGKKKSRAALALPAQRIANQEYRVRRKDGSEISILLSGDVIALGQHGGYFCILTDITPQKEAEEKRGKLRVRLAEAERMETAGRLAGGIAHDFNNMLQVITANAELALESVNAGNSLENNLLDIQEAARRSALLVGQLLAFARKQLIAPRIMNLNDIVEQRLMDLRRLVGKGRHVIWKPGPGLLPVKMDPAQMDQILTNLCANARDAVKRGGRITLETGRAAVGKTRTPNRDHALPGRYAMLSVSDDGCGMEPAVRKQIFEPFFTTRGFGKGSGMGLPTVYGIVHQNHGFLEVESSPGKGSTFRVFLPESGK